MTPKWWTPYTLPEERQGWRGVTIGGHHKRKASTVLNNEQVLVTALMLIPGERPIRHSLVSGGISITMASCAPLSAGIRTDGCIQPQSRLPSHPQATRCRQRIRR